MSPILEHDPAFAQGIERFPVQTLLSKPLIEALGIAVLPRASRLNVDRLDAVVSEDSVSAKNSGEEEVGEG